MCEVRSHLNIQQQIKQKPTCTDCFYSITEASFSTNNVVFGGLTEFRRGFTVSFAVLVQPLFQLFVLFLQLSVNQSAAEKHSKSISVSQDGKIHNT